MDLILDVEPQEAAALIGLIEMLFEEWYITRHDREQRVKKVKDLGQTKEAIKNNVINDNASKEPGWNAKVINKIAADKFGGLEAMFVEHGWPERGPKMIPNVGKRVKDHYGSVENFCREIGKRFLKSKGDQKK